MKRSLLLTCLIVLFCCGCSNDPVDLPRAEHDPPAEPAIESPQPTEPDASPAAVPATPAEAASSPSPASPEPPKAEPLNLDQREFSFDLDHAKYTLPAPSDAMIKRDQDHVEFHAGKRFNVRIEFGKRDLTDPQDLPIARTNRSEVLSQTADTLLFKDVDVDLQTLEKTTYFQFATNVTLGHRDFCVISLSRDEQLASTQHSEADCRAMLDAARQLALAEPLPNEPAAILEKFHATVGRNDAGEVVSLSLPAFGITDATMPLVAKVPTLTTLYASRIDANKESFAVLAALARLETLDLASTAVDDSAVEWLGKLKTLRKLTIVDTKITDAGREKLKAALPECEIE